MRPATSARFDTYYKIQCWEHRSLTWKDIQRAHATVDDAVAAAPAGERDVDWRIMEVAESGRQPLPA
jgi:hypothetical protein